MDPDIFSGARCFACTGDDQGAPKQYGGSIGTQAIILLIASLTGQLLRRRPLAELFGTLNWRWLKELCAGGLISSALIGVCGAEQSGLLIPVFTRSQSTQTTPHCDYAAHALHEKDGNTKR